MVARVEEVVLASSGADAFELVFSLFAARLVKNRIDVSTGGTARRSLARNLAAVSRRWLVSNVLDPEREGSERTLDVHVSRLRKKLGVAGPLVATVWGVGYRLESE